ncbi:MULTISPECIES: sigma factor-like helix-turn-helix DNA-binding protein [unclassified Streptomyces]|uniref:sigma factor-like helix-turn-helix DNA-binding protein n=1 Tax=unclassified Streptomyces TaxID=2593676 RepID=UPI003D72F10E
MGDRHLEQDVRRAREFEAFVAGAGGRLLHTATLLTGESAAANPRARRLLALALAHTYASWHRLRGEDPYDRTRRHLAVRFADGAWHQYGGRGCARPHPDSPLFPLTPRERLVLVLRWYEGVGEDQVGALLGMPAERVHAVCERATTTLLRPPPAPVRPPAGAKVAPS